MCVVPLARGFYQMRHTHRDVKGRSFHDWIEQPLETNLLCLITDVTGEAISQLSEAEKIVCYHNEL